MFDGEDRFWPNDRSFTRFEAWIDLIQQAEWRDRERMIDGELITIERGQLIASQRFLAERWNWSTGKVRRYLEMLVQLDRIEWKTNHPKNHLGAIITLVNYDDYQAAPSETNRETNHQRTTNEPPTNRNNNKRNKYKEGEEVQTHMGVTDSERSPNSFPKPGSLERNEAGDRIYPDAFEALWSVYPERKGSNRKLAAYRKWRSTVQNGADPDQLFIATIKYREFKANEGEIGTQYVMQAKTFFGPDEHWRQAWDDQPEPASPANQKFIARYQRRVEKMSD